MLRALRTLILFTLDTLCRLVPIRRTRSSITLRLDAIGDFFIWMQSGAVEVAAKARENGRRSILIANPAWSDYARKTGLWDDVVAISPPRLMRNPWYRIRALANIRRLGATLLIQPRAARVFLQEDAIARTCGAPLRIGTEGTLINISPGLQRRGNRYYERLFEARQERTVHEIVRNRDFTTHLTGKAASRFSFPDAAAVRTGRSIAIAVGAGQPGRVWPVAKLAQLILHIRQSRPSHDILLLGSAAEAERAGQIEQLVGAGLKNLVGLTALQEMVDIVAHAELVVCNDSSAYHIAMAVGSKVLCMLGGGHFGWYAPYPDSGHGTARERVLHVPMDCYWCNWQCRFPPDESGAFECVAAIPLHLAIAAVDSLLMPASA